METHHCNLPKLNETSSYYLFCVTNSTKAKDIQVTFIKIRIWEAGPRKFSAFLLINPQINSWIFEIFTESFSLRQLILSAPMPYNIDIGGISMHRNNVKVMFKL